MPTFLAEEAADEIERLQTENKMLELELEEAVRRIETAADEIERLRREIGLRQQPPPDQTKLVTRLRERAEYDDVPLFSLAADAIEQLQREVKTLQGELHRPYPGSLSEENDALIAECHELRAIAGRLREENKHLLEIAGAGVETTYQMLKQWGAGRKMPGGKHEP